MATTVGRPAASDDVFRAVADPTRRAALEVLGQRQELTVTELADLLAIGLPMLSRHLAVLREADLVTQRQVGRQRLYRLRAEPLRELFDWASYFSEFWDGKVSNLRRHLDRKANKDKA